MSIPDTTTMIKDIQFDTAFKELGWQPVFHSDLFEDLVIDQTKRTSIPRNKHVTLQIAPRQPQVPPDRPRRAHSASHQDGNYDRASNTIELYLGPNQARSNQVLYHVACHLVQDITDMYPRSRTKHGRFVEALKATRYEWPVGVLGLTIGSASSYTVYEAKHNMAFAVGLSAAMLVPSAIMAVRTAGDVHTPWEREAYHFEHDPATLQKYGNIITYQMTEPSGDKNEAE